MPCAIVYQQLRESWMKRGWRHWWMYFFGCLFGPCRPHSEAWDKYDFFLEAIRAKWRLGCILKRKVTSLKILPRRFIDCLLAQRCLLFLLFFQLTAQASPPGWFFYYIIVTLCCINEFLREVMVPKKRKIMMKQQAEKANYKSFLISTQLLLPHRNQGERCVDLFQ